MHSLRKKSLKQIGLCLGLVFNLTKSRPYLSIDPKKNVCHAHSNAHNA